MSVHLLLTVHKYFFVPGIFVLLLIVLLSVCLTYKMQAAQSDQLTKKDGRVQRIFETVTNLKVIKLHVWEQTFEDLVR